ncbi:hypothetical protein GINT2_001439 [Glugoides intestinalis]
MEENKEQTKGMATQGIQDIETVKENVIKNQQEEVFIRVYDLSKGMAKILSPQLLGVQVDGVWHTSIEAYGNEYFFHCGLAMQKAGTTHFNPCIERVSMGYTSSTRDELEEFFKNSAANWNEKTYDFLENNCNNFTNWLANFLVEKDIPSYILDLPKKMKNCENFRKLFNL